VRKEWHRKGEKNNRGLKEEKRRKRKRMIKEEQWWSFILALF
jgi:hypothetical protein